MIASLAGRVVELGRNDAVIEVAGIGWRLFASTRTLASLKPGEPARLLTELQAGQDQPLLFGFLDTAERAAFRSLTGVQGVGGRLALAILSTLSPGELVAAVAREDRAMLARSPGVGPRLAARLITELKPVFRAMGEGAEGEPPSASASGGAAPEALAALLALGLRPAEAERALGQAVAAAGADAPVAEIVRRALREVAR